MVFATRFSVSLVQRTLWNYTKKDFSLLVASKCGIAAFGDGSVTNSAEHIKEYIEGTIERLGFTPDLYYLHRIDPSVYPTWRNLIRLLTNY